MNNKGFTLIETLAVIVLLSVVLALGGYAVSVNLKNSKEDALKVLKENIKSGAINYYNECKYVVGINNLDSSAMCGGKLSSNVLTININDLKDYGFLESQGDEDILNIVNPVTNENIGDCKIILTYDSSNSNYSLTIKNEETKEKCQFIK